MPLLDLLVRNQAQIDTVKQALPKGIVEPAKRKHSSLGDGEGGRGGGKRT